MNTRARTTARRGALAILAIVASAPIVACTENPSPKDPSTTMNEHTSSAEVVKGFFNAFGKGDVEGVVATFHPQARIVAVRDAARKDGEVYGTYSGREGARAFVAGLGAAFDTQAFSVDAVVGEGKLAFASGSFTHKVKATGKLFRSDWALKCVIEDGKILEYHFFEDSAAFVEANH